MVCIVGVISAPQSLEMGFSINKNLYSNLMLWRNAVMNQDIDCVILVDGKEGSGKSVHAAQIAHALDKDHHIDIDLQVCFTPDDVKKAITSLSKFKAIIFDEARRGLNRRRSTQEVNLEITDLLAECRQNNLFLVVVMPTFYDMDMNVAVWRSRVLIHVTYKWDKDNPSKPLLRGFSRFYSESGKKNLYVNKELRMRYAYPFLRDMCFDYTFPHHYVFDEVKYREKKRQAEEHYRVSTDKKNKDKPSCPKCKSLDVRTNMKGQSFCRVCGAGWVNEKKAGTLKKLVGGLGR